MDGYGQLFFISSAARGSHLSFKGHFCPVNDIAQSRCFYLAILLLPDNLSWFISFPSSCASRHLHYDYFAPGRFANLAKYCYQHVCMCLCLSVCPFARISQNHTPKFNQIFCAYYMWPWLDPPLTAMLHMRTCTSGFVDDAVFSHNGANGPQSKTTRIKDNAYVSSSSPATAPGAKSAVSDYILC